MAIDVYWYPVHGTQQFFEVIEFTAVNNQLYTLIINGVTFTYTSDSSATEAEIAQGLLAEIEASTDPAVTAQTYEYNPTGDRLEITGPEDGSPFVVTIDGNMTVFSTTGVSYGPNAWIGNWAPADPADTDIAMIDNSDSDITTWLNQAAIQLTSLTIGANFTGTIGQPTIDNLQGYWHPEYLRIDATTFNIGTGKGSGSGRIKIDAGSYTSTFNIYSSGASVEAGIEPILIKGGSNLVINAIGGEVGIGTQPGATASVTTLRVGPDGSVRCGVDVVFSSATLTMDGGVCQIESAIGTINKIAGTLTILGDATVTTLKEDGGTTVYNSSGTITTLKVSNGGTMDFGQDVRPVTVTNCTLEAGSTLLDPFRRVTFTNPIVLDRCSIEDVTVNFGTHITVAIAAGP